MWRGQGSSKGTEHGGSGVLLGAQTLGKNLSLLRATRVCPSRPFYFVLGSCPPRPLELIVDKLTHLLAQ